MNHVKKRDVRSWVPTVYFGMGLPFVALNMVAVLMFKNMDIPDAQIAFWTSLIMWPWTVKFLWSPFLEMFRTKKFFIVVTQLVSGVGFGLVALSLQMPMFFAIAISLLAFVAVCGATQDIAGDGLYMAELTEKEQAKYIGWQGAFYNLAKLVATGGLVYLSGVLYEYFAAKSAGVETSLVRQLIESGDVSAAIARDASVSSWMIIMGLCAAIMLLLGFYHMKALPKEMPNPSKSATNAREAWAKIGEVVKLFCAKKFILYYIFWIIAYRLCEGFVMKIVPLFLKASQVDGGLGLSEQDIGLYYGSCGPGAFLLGSLLAGYFIANRGLKRSIFTLCCAFNLPFFVYAYFAMAQPENVYFIGTGIVLEYFGYGFGFVGLSLFMMQQIAKGEHQMSHYAIATGIMNFAVMGTGMVSGYLSDMLGYKLFFSLVMLAAIPAFIMTWFLPFTHQEEQKEESAS